MSKRPGGDGLNFDVTVNGTQGRKELDAILGKIRGLGAAAVASGGKIDKSTLDAAASYRKLAQEIVAATRAEDDLTRSADRARAARAQSANATATAKGVGGAKVSTANSQAELAAERVKTEEVRRRDMARQGENKTLLNQSAIGLMNDKREEVSDRRRATAAAAQSRAIQDRERQEAQAWAAREKQLRDEQKAQERMRAQTTAAFTQREQQQARVAAQAERQAAQAARANARATTQGQNDLYSQYMDVQRSYDRQNGVANINATRYALYDVSRTAIIAGTAVAGVGAAAIVSAAQFEASFINVQRTAELTGADIGLVRGQLVDLSTEINTSFANITAAATLGAQMNIAKGDLDSFAEVTSKFSSTTNASIETTAQSFGRLSNLLDVPASQFDKLGAAIYETGVKSVATETEILSTTQQIAGAAAAYDFLAADVVGLGAAFASLAIAPEAARGSVTRIFGEIEQAAGEGGEAMSQYARILKMTDEEAANLWKSDPGDFFQQLIEGLSKSGDLLKDLNAIGANDVRDVNLLQRLAKSPEVLANSMRVSNQAFAEGTALNDAYEVSVSTLLAKMQILIQSFQALAASAGGPFLAGLKAAVDILTHLVNLLRDQSWIATIVAGLALLVGGWLLVKGATAAAMAGLLALQFVLKQLDTQAVLTGINLRSLNALMIQTRAAAGVGAVSVGSLTNSVRGFAGTLATVGKGAGALLAITAALEAVNYTAQQVAYGLSSAGDKTEDYLGSLDGLADAMKADSEAARNGVEGIAKFTGALPDQSDQTKLAAGEAKNLANVLGETGDAAVAASEKANAAALTFGATSTEFIRAQLSQSKFFKDAAKDENFQKYWNEIGANTNDAIAASIADGEAGLDRYFDALEKKANVRREGYRTDGGGYDSYFNFDDGSTASSDSVDKFKTGLRGLREEAQDVADEQLIMGDAISTGAEQMDTAGDVALDTADAMSALGEAIDAMFASVNTQGELESSLYDLFYALEDGTRSFDVFSEAGRANFENLQTTILATAEYAASLGINVTDSLVPLFAKLQGEGIDTATLLQQLASNPIMFKAGIDTSAIGAALGGLNTGTTTLTGPQQLLNASILGQADAAKKNAVESRRAAAATSSMGKAAAAAAAKVKTLSDYVGELGGVMDDAFDFRFGGQEALDDITSQWNDIAEANAKAVDSLRDYMLELQELAAQKGTLEYWLGVAVEYEDDLRAAEIRAELAKVNADVADKQKEVDETSADMSKSLVGNSAAAIANRAQILGLVGSYGDYVKELANSGLNQQQLAQKTAELRAQFVQQATQLGYNEQQLTTYTASFDDLILIIGQVPRDITVKADPDPARRAIAEFMAENTGGRGASAGVNVPITTTYDGSGTAAAQAAMAKQARGAALESQMQALRSQLMQAVLAGQPYVVTSGISSRIDAISRTLSSGNYAQGGFVPGAAPANRSRDNMMGTLPDGQTVGLQGGEPIISNEARARYGDQLFRDINALSYKPAQSAMPQAQAASSSGNSGPTVVVIDQQQFQALVDSGRVDVHLGSDVVTKAANTTNQTYANLGRG